MSLVETEATCSHKRSKANWIRHILRKNCLLKHVIEGKIEVTGRRGRRRRQLLHGLKKTRRYWKLKEEALPNANVENSLWKEHGPVV
jgi:hypothetical protein